MERIISNVILAGLLVAGLAIALSSPGFLWLGGFLMMFFSLLFLVRINAPDDWESLWDDIE